MRRLLLACVAPFLVQVPAQAQALPQATVRTSAQTFTLPNGLRVVHLENHEHPLVRVLLWVPLEPSDVAPGHQGLPDLTLRLLNRSPAGELKADTFERSLAAAGIQFDATCTQDHLEWRLLARSRDQDQALGLLAERLARTALDPALLERERLDCWREREGLDLPPRERLARLLRLDPTHRPTAFSLGSISFEDILAFRARVLRPQRALLILHGDLGLEQAKRLLLLNLGAWTSGALESRPPAPFTALAVPPDPIRITTGEAGLRLQAWAPCPAEVSPESAALLRLLVVAEPVTHGIQHRVEASGLEWTLEAGVASTPAQALAQLQAEVEALRQRRFNKADLEQARRVYLAQRPLEALHPEAQLATALANATGTGVALGRLQNLRLEDLQADLARWLQPANLRIGALGPVEALKALKALDKP